MMISVVSHLQLGLERLKCGDGRGVSGLCVQWLVTLAACASPEDKVSRAAAPPPVSGARTGATAGNVSIPLPSSGSIAPVGPTPPVTSAGAYAEEPNRLEDSEVCDAAAYVGERKRLDIYMMVDDSGSMVPWWPATIEALNMFFRDPSSEGIGVGVNFFGSTCDVTSYATPRVPISALPGIGKVTDRASCDMKQGGWYFDQPGAPTRIIACESSCQYLNSVGGEVKVLLGCPTINVVPS